MDILKYLRLLDLRYFIISITFRKKRYLMIQIFNFEFHYYTRYKRSDQVVTNNTNEMLKLMKTDNYDKCKTYNIIEGFLEK